MDTTDSAYGDKLIRLDTFDTAVAVDPSAEDEAKRRFMTLILQTAHRNNGNIGHMLRATNTSGEVFAVKLLKDNAILSGQAPDRSAEQSGSAPGQHRRAVRGVPSSVYRLAPARISTRLWLRIVRG